MIHFSKLSISCVTFLTRKMSALIRLKAILLLLLVQLLQFVATAPAGLLCYIFDENGSNGFKNFPGAIFCAWTCSANGLSKCFRSS